MTGRGEHRTPEGRAVRAPGPGADRTADGEIRTVAARELLGPRGILRIEHEGELYTLRLTRNNRLILTK